jgi:hypothetical protein
LDFICPSSLGSTIIRGRAWGPERAKNLLMVTQQVKDPARAKIIIATATVKATLLSAN